MKKELNVKKLATQIVGDGKRPNKYFVTIAYGWYKPKGKEDMIQASNSLESSTVLFTNKQDALDFYNSVKLNPQVKEVTGETISQVMVEDRLTGVVIEKYLSEMQTGRYYIDEWN